MLTRTAILALAVAVIALTLFPVIGSAQTAPPPTTSLIVKLVPGLTASQQAEVIARNGGIEISTIPALRLHIIQVPTTDLAATLAGYQADPQVVRAEENKVRQSETVPTDPLYPNQWALPQIGWDVAFGTITPAGSAIVAVLDTGIDPTHPDLGSKVVAGTSILDGSSGMTDPNGHGTWMAGIIAAQTNTIPSEGIAGVAYAGVRMMPVTVLDSSGLGQDSDVIAGVIWAADHGANVILMGFSNPGFSPNLQDAIDYAWSTGAILVAAVGNGAAGSPTFPAGDRGVIGVSATDATDNLAGFSNWGEAAFLAAPGTNIQTTDLGGSYSVISGTSTSAAIVAGVAGFMKAVDPTLSNGVIVGRIARTADPAGTQAQTGNGRINMARALSDTGTGFIEPAGADPVGAGGPFVGPYLAASVDSVAITAPTSQVVLTALPATVTISFNYSTSTSGATSATVDLVGTGVSASKSGMASGLNKADSTDLVIPAGAAAGTYNVKVTVTNTFGNNANQKNDNKNALIKISPVLDSTPPSITPSVTGTQGSNNWYTSDVTVTWSVTDAESGIASSTGCASTTLTSETAGTTLTCSATNNAGLTNSASVTVKIDKTPPTAVTLAVTVGTLGTNGWYTSDVTVRTTGTDSISTPLSCTADQFVSTETTGFTVNGSCTNDAGLKADAAPLIIKLDKTGPTAQLVISAGTPGTNGWYTSDVTVQTQGSDSIASPVVCSADQFQTAETTGAVFNGSCTNSAGLTTNAAPLTVKLDKTPPTGVALSAAGTLGAHGWYVSDVTVHTTGTELLSTPITCTADQFVSTETTGITVNGSCTNNAGLKADAAPLIIKLDKTGPTAQLVVSAGAPGINGWYTSDVTVQTQGSDSIASPVICTADQFQTAETPGAVFNGSCTNNAGLTTNATPLTVKLDKTPPTGVALSVIAGTSGTNGWYTSDVAVHTTGTESISMPLICTADQVVSTETTGVTLNGSCTNDAGLSADAAPLSIKLDKTPPAITISSPEDKGVYLLNDSIASNYACEDGTSGIASCAGPVSSGTNFDTASVGPKSFPVNASDEAGNAASVTSSYAVQYVSGGTCLGSPGHAILQPINADGSSVFKQKSTVPAKFRVCDANGVSIGTAGVVKSFKMIKTVAGTAVDTVDEAVDSTTPDAAFRWDPTAQQWIFNINTKSLAANKTYFYQITLDDGSLIEFNFGLK